MAKAFGWSEPRVRRFLNRLKADAMIDAASDAGQTVITICHYDKYQAPQEASPPIEDSIPTQSGFRSNILSDHLACRCRRSDGDHDAQPVARKVNRSSWWR